MSSSTKGAIELSANFLVMLVIAIVVFGLSVTFIYRIFGASEDIGFSTQDALDDEIQDLQCAGEKVCLFKTSMTLEPGKFTNANTNGLKVVNILQEPKLMVVDIILLRAFDKQNVQITDQAALDNIEVLLLDPQFPLAQRESAKKGFGIRSDKETLPGTYIYQVTIRADTIEYYRGQFTVNIP